MDTVVFLAVLAAAGMHAGWNAFVKVGLDRFSTIVLLGLVHAAIAIPILPFVTSPNRDAWAWIAASAALHSGYKIFLLHAYRHGDLIQVYPIARGTAPLIVTALIVLTSGDTVAETGLAAVVMIAIGIILMGCKGSPSLGRMPPLALMFALGTAVFTASYTIIDGMGARIAGTASGFFLWMTLLDAVGIFAYALLSRGKSVFAGLRPALPTGLAAGTLSLGSYWTAIWAMTVAPIPLVAALRETSVLFAMLIAVVWLGEPLTRWRVLAAALILAGVVTMRI